MSTFPDYDVRALRDYGDRRGFQIVVKDWGNNAISDRACSICFGGEGCPVLNRETILREGGCQGVGGLIGEALLVVLNNRPAEEQLAQALCGVGERISGAVSG